MNLDPAKIMTTLMEVFSEMMFKYGFVHCDPHPGYEISVFYACFGHFFDIF